MANGQSHEDAKRAAAAQMAAAMAAMGPEKLAAMKKALRRKVILFAVGAAVTLVGVFLPASAGLPVWGPSAIMVAGGGIAMLGMLGPSRGSGCMAQITGVLWLLAVGCGVGTQVELVQYVLAGSAFVFALISLLAPKPREKGPLSQLAGFGGAGGANPGGFGMPDGRSIGGATRAKDRVIDIEAEEQ